ncbi:flagellar basal-body MS-ring/collar protein FliF [Steroidobacter sp.]|uniref:flagellar basal-body MS-ring/collar protein FliF n=1 Tax=Steroidobacter sp. TaxID=1978227 RepID=UPI0039F5E1BC
MPLVLLATVITAVVLMFAWRDQSTYKPLFGAREKVAAADMMTVLDGAGIPYRLHPDTGQVLVPQDRLGEVRMLLASKGVVAQLPAGLELMDRSDPLGVSQFVQDVRFRRGLEGELSQSIMTIDAIESARVHIAIAKSSSFVVNTTEPSSASVVLGLKPGRKLSNEQIAAIVKMVASSSTGLDPSRVTLVDQSGNLLSARVDLTDGFEANQVNDASGHYRDETQRSAENLLAPIVGNDNFKLSVTADVDNDRVQETREQYGDTPKVTNESTRAESDTDPLALGVPGSLSNRPVDIATTAQNAAESSKQRNASTRQFAYDRSVTQIQRSRGRLKKLSVAVVLNDTASPSGNAWTEAQLANIDRILRSGLGIDTARGDSLVVSSLGFPKPLAPPVWWKQPERIVDIGMWVVWAVIALFAYLLIARPLLRVAKQRLALPAPSLQQVEATAVPAAASASVAAAALPTPNAAKEPIPVGPLLEDYDLPPPGSPVDVMVDHLRALAAKEPERVAEVVKQWVQKNVRRE